MKLARLAPLVVLALLGCSPSPSTAAQVGDVTIPQQRVAKLVEQCPMVQNNEVTDQVALTFLVRTEILKQAGAANGVEMTDESLRDLLKQEDGAMEFIAMQPECIDILLPQAALTLLAEEASSEKLSDDLSDIDVAVNPRRYTWDENQAVIVEGSGSLSVPGGLA